MVISFSPFSFTFGIDQRVKYDSFNVHIEPYADGVRRHQYFARLLRIVELLSLRQFRTVWQTAEDDSHFLAHRLQLSSDQEDILLVETDDAVAGSDLGQTAHRIVFNCWRRPTLLGSQVDVFIGRHEHLSKQIDDGSEQCTGPGSSATWIPEHLDLVAEYCWYLCINLH